LETRVQIREDEAMAHKGDLNTDCQIGIGTLLRYTFTAAG